jgi:hypothetical protein
VVKALLPLTLQASPAAAAVAAAAAAAAAAITRFACYCSQGCQQPLLQGPAGNVLQRGRDQCAVSTQLQLLWSKQALQRQPGIQQQSQLRLASVCCHLARCPATYVLLPSQVNAQVAGR